jgi:predicted nuclease of predicted toxin-antitoxin system
VREVGLRDSGDSEIWDYAKLNGFIIVSKDSDFQQRSLLYGFPPKFTWLRVGIAGQSLLKIYCGNTRQPFTRSSRIPLSLT